MIIISFSNERVNDYFLSEVSTIYKKVEPIPFDILILAKDILITGSLKPFIKVSIQHGSIYCKGLHMIHKKGIPVFVDMPVLSVSELKKKDLHRYHCLQKLEAIRKIPYTLHKSMFQTVLIEFRPLPHLEFLIRNTMLHLPKWSHTVVCGVENSFLIQSWFPTLSIIKLPIHNLVASDYSRLLLTEQFWNLFHGEKLLIYQEDSMLFHGEITPFLKYDYVGAPWPTSQNDNTIGVGNGGFSLRTKKCMIECLRKQPVDTFIPETSTLHYIKNTNSTCVPEDVFFTKTMIEKKIGVVAPREVARAFSQESVKSENPLGGHQFWLADPPLKSIVLGTDYYRTVTHRGGWRSVIEHFIKKSIFKKQGILLIDCMEKHFMWDNKVVIQPWIGIAHYSILKGQCSLDNLMSLDTLKTSLPYCNGIIVLTKHNLKALPNVRAIAIKHPCFQHTREFSMKDFLTSTPSVIQLGSQDRIVDFVTDLKISYPKLSMPGRHVKSKIPVLFTKKEEDYDTILCKNIIVIPLEAASANNSILEIISMNIPAFVSRLPSTEEYLGKEYPLFFQTKKEVETILNDRPRMMELFQKTHDYLKHMDKTELSIETFQTRVVQFCLGLSPKS